MNYKFNTKHSKTPTTKPEKGPQPQNNTSNQIKSNQIKSNFYFAKINIQWQEIVT